MMKRYGPNSTLASCVAALCLLITSAPVYAWNSNTNFCFPNVGTPTINGDLSDPSWNSAGRYVNDQGVMIPNSMMLGASDGSHLYLAFMVNQDSSWSSGDAVVVAFEAPPSGTGTQRALVLLLGQASGAALVPSGFRFNGAGWVGETPPAGTQAAATHTPTNGGSWTVELKIPLAGYGLPVSGNFGFYANTLPTDSGLALDHPWPPGTPQIGGVFNPTNLSGLLTSTSWGQGKTSASATACGGVSIASSDIYATNSINPMRNYTIATNATNTFHAIVRNNSTDITGSFVDANNIVARFKLAQWGISGNWIDTPTTNTTTTNPTQPATIPANGSLDRTMQWSLSPPEVAQYNTPATRHQCIRVELETQGATTAVITNRVAQVNMDFGLASRYVAEPRIDPRGWEAPPAGQTQQKLILRTSQRIDMLDREFVMGWLNVLNKAANVDITTIGKSKPSNDLLPWENLKTLQEFPVAADPEFDNFVTTVKNPSAQISQLTYLVHGCRRTGRFIEINYQKLELCENVGAFGQVVRHAGIGDASWDAALTGTSLEKRGAHYELTLAPDQPVTLKSAVSASEKDKGKGCGGLFSTFRTASAVGTATSVVMLGIAAYWPRWLRKRL